MEIRRANRLISTNCILNRHFARQFSRLFCYPHVLYLQSRDLNFQLSHASCGERPLAGLGEGFDFAKEFFRDLDLRLCRAGNITALSI
jgi:hypothetical protein